MREPFGKGLGRLPERLNLSLEAKEATGIQKQRVTGETCFPKTEA